MLLLILVQAAAAQAPDIEFGARVRARDVRIEQSGEISLTVRGGPGSDVRVLKPQAQGRRRLRNVTVEVHAKAHVTNPQQNQAEVETRSPQ